MLRLDSRSLPHARTQCPLLHSRSHHCVGGGPHDALLLGAAQAGTHARVCRCAQCHNVTCRPDLPSVPCPSLRIGCLGERSFRACCLGSCTCSWTSHLHLQALPHAPTPAMHLCAHRRGGTGSGHFVPWRILLPTRAARWRVHRRCSAGAGHRGGELGAVWQMLRLRGSTFAGSAGGAALVLRAETVSRVGWLCRRRAGQRP